jgi:hypothetical protein
MISRSYLRPLTSSHRLRSSQRASRNGAPLGLRSIAHVAQLDIVELLACYISEVFDHIECLKRPLLPCRSSAHLL